MANVVGWVVFVVVVVVIVKEDDLLMSADGMVKAAKRVVPKTETPVSDEVFRVAV